MTLCKHHGLAPVGYPYVVNINRLHAFTCDDPSGSVGYVYLNDAQLKILLQAKHSTAVHAMFKGFVMSTGKCYTAEHRLSCSARSLRSLVFNYVPPQH